MPTQKIWPFRLDMPDRLDVVCRHLFDMGVWCCLAVDTARLQPIDRSNGPDLANELIETNDVPASARNAEQRRVIAPGLHGHQWRPHRGGRAASQHCRQVRNRCALE